MGFIAMAGQVKSYRGLQATDVEVWSAAGESAENNVRQVRVQSSAVRRIPKRKK